MSAVVRVVVTATRQVLEPGDSVRFTAQAFDAQGMVLPTATITWSSNRPTVATVDNRGLVTAVAVGTAQISAAADGQTGSADVSVSIPELCECTRIIDSTSVQLIQRNDSTGIFVFRVIGNQLPVIDSGSIIVGAEDGGFLRRVHRVVRSADLITVQTTQAYLDEAVRDGEFATTSQTDGEDVPFEETQARWGPWTTTYIAPDLTNKLTRACCSIPLNGVTLSFKVKPDTNKKHPVNVSGNIDFAIKKGELVFAPRVDIGGQISAFALQNFRSIFRGDYGLNIDSYEGRVTLTAAFPIIKPLDLAPESKTFIVQQRPFATFIGPMPLVGIITKSLKLQVTPTISGTAVLVGNFRAGVGVTAGVRWARDVGWSSVSGASSYFEAEGPKFAGARVSAALKIAVVAEYSVQFYGIAGPYANISPYLQGTGSVMFSTAGDGSGNLTGIDWEVKAAAGLDVGVGAKVTVLGRKDLLSAGFTIPLIKPWTFWRDFSDGPVTARAITTGDDQPASLTIRVRPAFEDKWELGFGDFTLVSIPGPPILGRDLSTSSQEAKIAPNEDSVTFQRVRSGKSFKHTVRLHDLPAHCAAADSSADTVAVKSEELNNRLGEGPTRANFYVNCIPLGALRIRTHTTGADPTSRSTLTLTRRDTVGSGKGEPPLTMTIPGGPEPPDTVIDKLVPANVARGANGRIDTTLDPGRRNCAVARPATHQSTITSGDTAFTEFWITCVALGHVLVRTTTSDPDAGAPSDPIAYLPNVLANDAVDRVPTVFAPVGANGTSVVSGLVALYNASGASGRHTVTLGNSPNRCTEAAGFTRAVTVFPGDTAIAPFAISCVDRVHIATRSTGPATDPNGYIVVIEQSDGSADSIPIAATDTIGIAGVRPGPATIRLIDVDPSCTAPASVNRTISGRDSTLIAFSVNCPGPNAPTGLRATRVTTSEIDVAWNPAPPNRPVAYYKLYRTNTSTPGPTVVVDSIGTLTYNDLGLTPFTRYQYQVAAVDQNGVLGPRSAPLIVRTRDATPPTAATLSAIPVSSSRINVSWTAASDPETGVSRYRIYRDGSLIDSTSATSYAEHGLGASTPYTYFVIAVNGEGLAGPASNSATATTLDGSPPTAPAGLTATPISTSRIDLTWTAASDPQSGIQHYKIYRNGAALGSSATLGFADQGLTPNTAYSYEVAAVNGVGLEGPRSAPATATTHAPPITGSLVVNTVTGGSNIPGAGYQVEVIAVGVSLTKPVGISASVSFSVLAPQTYTVTLQNLPTNCAVDDGPNPKSVVVVGNVTVSTTFHVRCQ